MVSGMSKRGSYGSMAERIARSRNEEQPATPASASPLKHCWVNGAGGRVPALLLEWHSQPDGWHARVVRPVQDVDGWVVVEEWLPAGLLEPTE